MPNRWCRSTAYPIAAGSAARTTGKTIGTNRSRSGRTSDSGATTTYIDTMNTAAAANVATSSRTSRSRTARTPNRTAATVAVPISTTAHTTPRTATTGWNPSSGLSSRAATTRTQRQPPGVEHPAPPAFGTPSGNTVISSASRGRLRAHSAPPRRALTSPSGPHPQQKHTSPHPGSSPGRRRRRRADRRHVAAGATAAPPRPARRTRTARRPGTSPRAPQGSTRRRRARFRASEPRQNTPKTAARTRDLHNSITLNQPLTATLPTPPGTCLPSPRPDLGRIARLRSTPDTEKCLTLNPPDLSGVGKDPLVVRWPSGRLRRSRFQ